MKSYSFIIIFVLTVFLGCGKRDDPSPFIANDQSRTIDSLKKAILQKDSAYIGLKSDYKSWIIHTFDTESQCLAFAKMVKNNPTNAVFNEGWVKRKFLWTHEWKKKK